MFNMTNEHIYHCEIRVLTASDNTWRTVHRNEWTLEQMKEEEMVWRKKYANTPDVVDVYCLPSGPSCQTGKEGINPNLTG